MWRVAKSLLVLRDQVNAAHPLRDKSSDGTIAGDEHHVQNPNSDHEPKNSAGKVDYDNGVVCALDITNDPAHGVDSRKLAESLIAARDKRIRYVISRGEIAGDEGYAQRNHTQPWTWGPYNGANAHTEHMHVSVNMATADDETSWQLEPVAEIPAMASSGKGSWYSQYQGQYTWRDPGDTPNSNALGVPDNRQGIAFLNRATLGKWFNVKAPNGKELLLIQSDIGPSASTGRLIDISARAAEAFGYSPTNFPTDSVFSWTSAAPPVGLEHLTPKGQAVAYDPIQEVGVPAPPPVPSVPPAIINMQVSGNVKITINGTTVFVPD